MHTAPVHQGDLGGVAHRSAAGHIHGGVAGQQADLQQQLLGRIAHVGFLRLHQLAVRPDLLHGHLVLSQGAGLIRADHLHRAQAFHRLELLDDGVLTGHFLGAHGQHDGHDAAQSLGNGSNRQRHGEEQGVQQAHAAAEQRQAEHQRTDGQDGRRQLAGEVVQALLQGGLALLGLVHQLGNVTQLGVHAGTGDQHHRAAVSDQRAGEHHVLLVSQGGLARRQSVGGLLHRLGFTGQRALVHLQGIALQQAAVGNHQVARLQVHDVAGHHLGTRHFLAHAVPQDLGHRGGHGFQAFQTFFRLQILHGAQHRVHDEHRKDDQSALHIAGHHGDHRRHGQNKDQQVLKLLQEDHQRAFLFAFRQLVGAVLLQPPGSLLSGQAVCCGLYLLQGLRNGFVKIGLFHTFVLLFHSLPVLPGGKSFSAKEKRLPDSTRKALLSKSLVTDSLRSGAPCQALLRP